MHRWGPRGPPAAEAGTRSWAEEDWGRDDDDDGDGDGDGDGDEEEEEEHEDLGGNFGLHAHYSFFLFFF